ncbi:GNAT family N-acetyltransferase [Dechloromonas sp. XY25]|uniref:GNAT family N-acetyltransferase n=1 Tax=Dechloromonas hankyongensis TaxID=2908002 RepID=A0ABS9K1N1_9RHOO|nr:GNAT family N-acetyltransferase [Dechloromonas hankyongensis]MCG2576999.1 GNAT family N-acetyltransferase [Dechloromonas hankyongensis]
MHRDSCDFATTGKHSPYQVGGITARNISPSGLDSDLIEAWRCLAEHALVPNAYLTPMFILPALTHIAPPDPVSIILIETGRGDLIGLGVFQTRRLLPFFHWQALVSFRSKHTYLSGLLVDGRQAPAAVDAFFAFVSRPGSGWHGVRFDWLSAGDALDRLLQEVAHRRHLWWSESARMRRAVLLPWRHDTADLIARIPKAVLKNLHRCRRRLEENGPTDWRIHYGNEVGDEVVERFIALEHMGWKGKAGTSVRADPAHERFFREMIAGFRDTGSVFFTELLHAGQVIASTCNLVSGNAAFAFKISWDPACARYSPGMLNELHLLERAKEAVGHFDLVDSGSVEGGFIDKLWLDKRELVSGVFATTGIGTLLLALAGLRRRIRQVAASLGRTVAGALPGFPRFARKTGGL